jgi:hypothetical protein
MKYIVDIDALVGCLTLIGDTVKVNGNLYVSWDDVKAFIERFPKDLVKEEEPND